MRYICEVLCQNEAYGSREFPAENAGNSGREESRRADFPAAILLEMANLLVVQENFPHDYSRSRFFLGAGDFSGRGKFFYERDIFLGAGYFFWELEIFLGAGYFLPAYVYSGSTLAEKRRYLYIL